jgi:hypothetical protein
LVVLDVTSVGFYRVTVPGLGIALLVGFVVLHHFQFDQENIENILPSQLCRILSWRQSHMILTVVFLSAMEHVVITTMDGLLLFELITEQQVNQQRREISGDLLSQGSSWRQWLCALSIQQAF